MDRSSLNAANHLGRKGYKPAPDKPPLRTGGHKRGNPFPSVGEPNPRFLETAEKPVIANRLAMTGFSTGSRTARGPFFFIRFRHWIPPRVAAMTALMVCIRFSASRKTMDCSLSNTASVTSMAVLPNFSPISLPIWVLRSW